jgi:hypothetical protein
VAHVVVDFKDFEDAHSTLVADLTTSVAAYRLHDLRLRQLPGLDSQCAQFRLAKFSWLFAVGA